MGRGRPDRPGPVPGRPRRRRRGRPLRGDPGAGSATGGRDVPDQRPLDVQRLPGRGRRRRSGGSSGPRARRYWACRSIGRRTSPRSTRRSRPRPESSYSLSKLVGETMATEFARRTGVPFVGLRISNIMEPTDYAEVPGLPVRRAAAEMEPVGVRRRAGRRRRGPRRARGGHDRRRGLHRRRGRHGHDPRQRRPHGRGLPRRAAPTRGPRPRDAARDRPGPRLARLSAGPRLAG